MRGVKGIVLVLMVVLVGFGAVCALAGGGKGTAKEKQVRALELLDKYTETQDKLRSSFISQSKTTIKFKGYDHQRPALKKDKQYESYVKIEIRSDGDRHYAFHKGWGDRLGMHTTTEEHSNHAYALWDMNNRYQYTYHPDTPADLPMKNGWVGLTPKDKLRVPTSRIWTGADGGPGRGFFYGGDVRIDSEMREGGTISLQPEREEINGSECYVINAKAKGCRYKIWIDPKHDYHIVKAIVERDWWSASRPEAYSKKPSAGKSQTVLKNVSFKKIGDVWLPAEFDYTLNTKTVSGDYLQSDYHHKITEFMVDPDHDALRSFEPDFIKNGAAVFIKGHDGIEYTWLRGARYVVDDEGRVVSYDPNEGRLPLVKTLPPLKDYKIKKSPRWSKDKIVVMCFIDVEQRASQECAAELKELEESLAEKGVVVVLVQASEIEAEELERWKIKNKIRLALGRLPEKRIKEILGAWRVERLPWLILADREHIVTAEGFGLDELEKKIKEACDVEL